MFKYFLLILLISVNSPAFALELSTAGNNIGIGTTDNSTALVVAGTVSADAFSGRGASNDTLINQSAGNTGIGSASPGTKLDVQGTTRTTAFQLSTSPTAGHVLVSSSVGVGTWMSPSSIGAGSVANPTGTIGLSAVNGSATSAIRSDGAPALSQAISPTWTGNHIFNPSSGDTVVTNGNFGIGTAVPGAKLQVVNAGQNFTITGANVGIGTTFASNSALTVMSGNVGIGTWIADTATLTVGTRAISSGAIPTRINLGSDFSTTPGDNLKLKIYDASGLDYGFGVSSGRMDYVVNATSDNHVFYGGANVIVILKGTGNVGVGTVTPLAKLAVAGNIGVGTNANSTYMTTVPPNGGMIVEKNVGIGTLNPGALLDISGGRWRVVGIGTTVPSPLCMQADGTVGHFAGAWAGTCN